ncbi:phage holin family protein [Enterococcus sp. BWM-S5]|uniref:Phage holin family protein n=1 Tax=Enterococcus larvae TaxID=2794352 RepID=A0ABS4CGB7_9ENTE|nr:phage holin family protein [Enterococcus larvae]MBP1045263.1 phage holin family protein [Enterococcus larvae]
MEKYFNSISMVFGLIGGIAVGFLGGMDTILHVIMFLVVLDYLTGIAKGIKRKDLSSAIGFIGLMKKVMIFVVIALAVELEKLTGNSIPLREVVIMFYIANEGISLLENISEFLPLPEKLTQFFLQIRDSTEKEDE